LFNTSKTSRREFVAAAALLGASALIPESADVLAAPSSQPTTDSVWSAGARKQATGQLLDYFGKTAPQLLRPAEGMLQHPSIACSLPGKRYSTNLWDWDTNWTARGLFSFALLKHDFAFVRQVGEHAIGSFTNFFDRQSDEGRIPMLIDVHSSDPLGCLKKDRPKSQNQAKPVFGQLALLISEKTGSVDWLASQFDKLLRFYASWVSGNQSAIGLFVWGNDVAIGNDNDPTTFGRPDFSSANLLLNCLFYMDLRAAAELARQLRRPDDQQRLRAQADALGEQIQKYCWDPRDQFYYTVDVQCVDRRSELIHHVKPGMDMSWKCLPMRIQTFTGFLPLWCGLASPDQGKALIRANYLADDRFRGNWGVRSLSSKESMYYPDTGAALSQKGFMDWNLLVLEMI
jgi:putative isomerase